MAAIRPTPSTKSDVDVLSQVLSICRSEHTVTARFSLGAPWGLSSTGVPGALLRLARGACYWLELPKMPALCIEPGDLVMVCPHIAHRIVSSPGNPATPFSELISRHATGAQGENPLVFAHGGEGEMTDLFSAHMWFSAYCRHTILSALPPFIHVKKRDLPVAEILAQTMQELVDETLARQPGWRISAARMGEMLLVNILRAHFCKPTPNDTSQWLGGVRDPSVSKSIMAIHRWPAQAWTVQTLAQEAGLSRTRFAQRFLSLMGTSPIRYLTTHRMAVAAQALETGGQTLSRIAQDVGYESAKEFSRAFQRWAGLSPSAYLRRETERRAGVTPLDES